ncbi:MAG: hypothetical protein A2687_01620 [Candidatus Levybacteria bacterium RIFCSPHIGHO2_01_FULL_38_26]|nr:MAG: hypothetical protein A2687_01620 [Candidatus Levybacteria bacterium RIFCSPHIGHO2_01_FULL_38_26]
MQRVRRTKKDFISVVIPAYKQEKTIAQNLSVVKKILEGIDCDFEIIVVVDGLNDKTFPNAKKIKSPKIKVLGYKNNRGKGYAVRYGMGRAVGTIVCFIDAGMDLDPKGIVTLLDYFKLYKADIVIGSKRHTMSRVIYPWSRRIISFLSQIFVKILFGLNVKDTQVGLKMFRKEVVRDVLPRLLVKKFAFDIEFLVVAYALGYKNIYEAPVEINHEFSASIISKNIMRELFRTLWDTLAIFYRLNLVKYYTSEDKGKWKNY